MRLATEQETEAAIGDVRRMPDLELVRRFEAGGTGSPAIHDELVRRVRRDRGWLIPGVAILLPGRDEHDTVMEHVSLRRRSPRAEPATNQRRANGHGRDRDERW